MTTTTALLVTWLLAAPPAKAPAPAPAKAQEDGDTKKARELFQWAQKLYKQARYMEAIGKFEEAYALRPHPVIYFNIGKCHEQLGDTPKALRAYRDYLRLAPEANDRETVSDAIANLERRLKERGVQQLMVFTEPPNARIEVDGKALGSAPATVELQAGNHKMTVSADGFETVDRSFVMSATRSMEMTINLRAVNAPKDPGPPPPTPPLVDAPKKDEPKKTAGLTPTGTGEAKPDVTKQGPPPVMKKKGKVFTWVAAGAAVAGAGAATGLGLAASGAKDAYVASAGQPYEQRLGLYNNAAGLETGTNVAWAVAGTAAVTAVVLFFVEGK